MHHRVLCFEFTLFTSSVTTKKSDKEEFTRRRENWTLGDSFLLEVSSSQDFFCCPSVSYLRKSAKEDDMCRRLKYPEFFYFQVNVECFHSQGEKVVSLLVAACSLLL